jgi:hypothetical protein
MAANIVESNITFVKALRVDTLTLLGGALSLTPPPQTLWMVYAPNSTTPPITVNLSNLADPRPVAMSTGGWFGLVSPGDSAAHLYTVSGEPVRLEVCTPARNSGWFTVFAPLENRTVVPGDSFHMKFTAVSFPVTMLVNKASQLVQLREYMLAPTGVKYLQGIRVNSAAGLIDMRAQPGDYRVELAIPRPSQSPTLPNGTALPLRVELNKHWSAGLFQLDGYSLGHYYNYSKPGQRRYTSLGLDDFGVAHVPLYVGRALLTHVMVGHPVVASGVGTGELRIQVTRVTEQPSLWHCHVNNPTEKVIVAELRQNMPLPGLRLANQSLTLQPGELRLVDANQGRLKSDDVEGDSKGVRTAMLFDAFEPYAAAPSSTARLLDGATPAGSGWRSKVLPQHLQALELTRRHQQQQLHLDSSRCPNATWVAAAETDGLLSVKLFGAPADGENDDAPAVRAAMNASLYCGGCVFFPSGKYHFSTTVVLSNTCWKGGGGTGAPGMCVDNCAPTRVSISGPKYFPRGTGKDTPTIAITSMDTFLENFDIEGETLAIYISNAALVRFINVGAQINTDSDDVDASVDGCNRTNCNIVLGSTNAAMVVESSFWLWFERCGFNAIRNSGLCPHYPQRTPPCDYGQRPSVILRGMGGNVSLPQYTSHNFGVATIYIVRFQSAVFTGGGVQYQQVVAAPLGYPGGYFDFVGCSQEQSATPLLDIQSNFKHAPAVSPYKKDFFAGLQQVVIQDYQNFDFFQPHFGSGWRSAADTGNAVVAVNCSLPGCELDGLRISSAGFGCPVAVRLYSGDVTGATIIGGSARGGSEYSAHAVLNASGQPVGTWRQNDGAGWLMSSDAQTPALSFLVSGEARPRKVIRADGTSECRREDAGSDEPPTLLQGHLANATAWDPPPLTGGGVATTWIELKGLSRGDVLSAGLSSMDPLEHTVQLTAMAGKHVAKVVLHNLDGGSVDIGPGLLRVVVVKIL